jgi:hypothetical protein
MFWVWVCNRRYPACNDNVAYCHLRPVRLYSIFTHYLVNGTIFEKKKRYLTLNVYFDFPYKVCVKYFWFWEDLREIRSKCTLNFVWSARYSWQILMKIIFSGQIFVGTAYNRFYKILSNGCWVVPYGRTDRQTRRSQWLVFAILRTRLKTNQFMLYKEIVTACSEIQTDINSRYEKNVEFFSL